MVGIHANLLCRWRKGRIVPTIDLLLRVCSSLGVSLWEFLLGETNGLNKEARPVVVTAPRRKPRLPPASYDAEELRQAIETVPTGDAPLSVAETARQLGCPSAVLSRLCPDAYRVVADRYQAYRSRQREERMQLLTVDIRRVMTQLDSAGIYPASKRVRPLLQRRIHPRNSDYNRIHHQLLDEFGWTTGGTRIARGQSAEPGSVCNSSSQ